MRRPLTGGAPSAGSPRWSSLSAAASPPRPVLNFTNPYDTAVGKNPSLPVEGDSSTASLDENENALHATIDGSEWVTKSIRSVRSVDRPGSIRDWPGQQAQCQISQRVPRQGKPPARVGRKAMGPSWIARLPKG